MKLVRFCPQKVVDELYCHVMIVPKKENLVTNAKARCHEWAFQAEATGRAWILSDR